MAIYHCSVSVGSRSNGSSAVASDAYREGKKITNERTGEIHDFSRKKDVIESETLAPKNAPDFCRDSSQLWNKVEATEKMLNSLGKLLSLYLESLPTRKTKN